MSLTTKIRLVISAALSSTIGLSAVAAPVAVNNLLELANGTGADQANQVFSDQRTLAASATENLDLAGALTDAFGGTVAFTKIKALMIKAAAGNTNNVVVGGAASNGFVSPFGGATHTVSVPPGGTLLLTAPDATGFAVTAGTADLLKVANGGGGTGVTYDIVLVGVE